MIVFAIQRRQSNECKVSKYINRISGLHIIKDGCLHKNTKRPSMYDKYICWWSNYFCLSLERFNGQRKM